MTTTQCHKITLVESRARAILQTEPDLDVLLNGRKVGCAYFNMTGYRVVLPLPGGRVYDPGEVSLTKLRREVSRINREARTGEG